MCDDDSSDDEAEGDGEAGDNSHDVSKKTSSDVSSGPMSLDISVPMSLDVSGLMSVDVCVPEVKKGIEFAPLSQVYTRTYQLFASGVQK